MQRRRRERAAVDRAADVHDARRDGIGSELRNHLGERQVCEQFGRLAAAALLLQRNIALAVRDWTATGDELEQRVGGEAGEADGERAIEVLALMA